MTAIETLEKADLPDLREIARQIEDELALLVHIEKALRVALNWRSEGEGNDRKLSTLRFITGSFERHLARMRALAADGGYMRRVTEAKPHLVSAVEELKQHRDELQVRLEQIMLRLEHLDPQKFAAFDELCAELKTFFDDLSTHDQQEMELLQHSFAQEEGGSG